MPMTIIQAFDGHYKKYIDTTLWLEIIFDILTCPCNVYSPKLNSKTRVSLYKFSYIHCGYSLKTPRGGSNVCTQSMFSAKIRIKIEEKKLRSFKSS